MTTSTTNPGAGVGGSGGLTLDQGAAAIGELDRPTREQPRDARSGRYTRDGGDAGGQSQDQGYADDDEDAPGFGDDDAYTDGSDPEGEDEGDGAEDELEAAADDDGEDESGEDQRREPTYKVRVNGEEMEVPASELVAGYQRNADYTQKSQALAQERRELDTHRQKVVAERGAYTHLVKSVADFLQTQAPSEEIVSQLMMQDPVEAFRAKQVRDGILSKAKEFSDAYEQMVAAAQQEAAEAFRQEMLAGLKRIPELIPEWRDAKRESVERPAVLQYALQHFSEAELREITDPRAMAMLRKAMLYDRTMAGQKGQKLKPVKGQPADRQRGSDGQARRAPAQGQPPARREMQPGPRAPQNQRGANMRQIEQVRTRARQSGSVEDVAALISLTE